jgi:hypothetical protein
MAHSKKSTWHITYAPLFLLGASALLIAFLIQKVGVPQKAAINNLPLETEFSSVETKKEIYGPWAVVSRPETVLVFEKNSGYYNEFDKGKPTARGEFRFISGADVLKQNMAPAIDATKEYLFLQDPFKEGGLYYVARMNKSQLTLEGVDTPTRNFTRPVVPEQKSE